MTGCKDHRSRHEIREAGTEASRSLAEWVPLTMVTSAILNNAQIPRKEDGSAPALGSSRRIQPTILTPSPSTPASSRGWGLARNILCAGPSASDLGHGSEPDGTLIQASETQVCGIIFCHQTAAKSRHEHSSPCPASALSAGSHGTSISLL